MYTVWKWDVGPSHSPSLKTTLSVPEHTRIFHAAIQKDRVCVWGEAPATDGLVDITIFTRITGGEPMASTGEYIDSIHYGPFVWHIYAKY